MGRRFKNVDANQLRYVDNTKASRTQLIVSEEGTVAIIDRPRVLFRFAVATHGYDLHVKTRLGGVSETHPSIVSSIFALDAR